MTAFLPAPEPCELPPTADRFGRPIKVGSVVRSLDFPDRDAEREAQSPCFVEGIVRGAVRLEGCTRYRVEVTRRVFGGDEVEAEAGEVFPPINGTLRLFGGTCNGVMLVAPLSQDEVMRKMEQVLRVVASLDDLDEDTATQVEAALMCVDKLDADMAAHLDEIG